MCGVGTGRTGSEDAVQKIQLTSVRRRRTKNIPPMAPMAAMVRAGGSGTTDTAGVTLTLSISTVWGPSAFAC